MSWTDEELRVLILELRTRGGDSTLVEVKRGAGGVPRCAETLCAFGNMPGGGTIIVGLNEAAGFTPVTLSSIADTEAGIAAQARTAVQPPVAVDFQRAQVDGVDIVLASVAGLPSHQRPCRTGGKAYLRQADGDYVMSEQEIQQILSLRERPRYDASPIEGASGEDLDAQLVRSYLSQVRSSSRRLATEADAEIMRRKCVTRGEAITVAGAYALGSFPQEFEPSLSITAAVQLPGDGDARSHDLQHFDGPLPEMLDAAMEWVRRNTQTSVRVGEDGHARDSSEIPMVAVRELVANALVHRDLGPHTRGKRVEIRLLDDQLVITNPGGLWGISRQQLGRPEGTSAVNEFLYDVCKYTRTAGGDRVIEGEGGGIRAVERSLRSAGLAPPRFIDRGIGFTVIVPRHALLPTDDIAWLTTHDPARQLSPMQAQILTSMRHGQTWSNATVREAFPGTDSRNAHGALARLVELGFAESLGQRGGRQYRLNRRWDLVPINVTTQVSTSYTPPVDQDPLLELTSPATDTTINGPFRFRSEVGISPAEAAVTNALSSGPLTVRALTQATGLTESRVRYALRSLISEQAVAVNGGWGVKGTTYQLQESAER